MKRMKVTFNGSISPGATDVMINNLNFTEMADRPPATRRFLSRDTEEMVMLEVWQILGIARMNDVRVEFEFV